MDSWWAVVNTVMNLPVLRNAGNLLTSVGAVNFSERALLLDVSCVTWVCCQKFRYQFAYPFANYRLFYWHAFKNVTPSYNAFCVR